MQLVKYRNRFGTVSFGVVDHARISALRPSGDYPTLQSLLEADDPAAVARSLLSDQSEPIESVSVLAPIDAQEVWAAGVTYKRSRTARMEESETAASCYDRVYVSPRPELFMKATPHRVSGPNEPLRIRADASWNVPEPELTLVINSRMQLV